MNSKAIAGLIGALLLILLFLFFRSSPNTPIEQLFEFNPVTKGHKEIRPSKKENQGENPLYQSFDDLQKPEGKKGSFKVLFGVISSPRRSDARHAIRATWMNEVELLNHELKFFIEADNQTVNHVITEKESQGDIILLQPEDGRSKSRAKLDKLFLFWQYASQRNDIDVVVRCEDDIFPRVPVIHSILQGLLPVNESNQGLYLGRMVEESGLNEVDSTGQEEQPTLIEDFNNPEGEDVVKKQQHTKVHRRPVYALTQAYALSKGLIDCIVRLRSAYYGPNIDEGQLPLIASKREELAMGYWIKKAKEQCGLKVKYFGSKPFVNFRACTNKEVVLDKVSASMMHCMWEKYQRGDLVICCN